MTSEGRPKLVTTLTLGVLTLATLYLVRFGLGLTLPKLPLSVPAWYIPLTGAFWGVGALVVAYGLFTGRAWAPGAARWGAVAFAVWYWADRLIFARSDYAQRTIPASTVITVLGLAGVWVILRTAHVRSYYKERDL